MPPFIPQNVFSQRPSTPFFIGQVLEAKSTAGSAASISNSINIVYDPGNPVVWVAAMSYVIATSAYPTVTNSTLSFFKNKQLVYGYPIGNFPNYDSSPSTGVSGPFVPCLVTQPSTAADRGGPDTTQAGIPMVCFTSTGAYGVGATSEFRCYPFPVSLDFDSITHNMNFSSDPSGSTVMMSGVAAFVI